MIDRFRGLLPLLQTRIFDQLVIKTLMRPFGMIMISVLRAEHIYMFMTDHNKIVQAFLARGVMLMTRLSRLFEPRQCEET